jgi:hypothetical protein
LDVPLKYRGSFCCRLKCDDLTLGSHDAARGKSIDAETSSNIYKYPSSREKFLEINQLRFIILAKGIEKLRYPPPLSG